MAKSPFSKRFIQVCFVAGPTGEQHIFQLDANGRLPFSFCGKDAGKISSDEHGNMNAVQYKDRVLDRPVCAKCEVEWKQHPQSPWKVWGG
jgi:hypothetical protein